MVAAAVVAAAGDALEGTAAEFPITSVGAPNRVRVWMKKKGYHPVNGARTYGLRLQEFRGGAVEGDPFLVERKGNSRGVMRNHKYNMMTMMMNMGGWVGEGQSHDGPATAVVYEARTSQQARISQETKIKCKITRCRARDI